MHSIELLHPDLPDLIDALLRRKRWSWQALERGDITVQDQVATGVLFILLFAIGHCLPIVVAGSSTAVVKRVMESSSWQGAGNWFRKGAAAMIFILAAYFIISPFVSI